MDLKGKLVQKLNIESGVSKSDKEWEKQTIIIDTGDQYNPNIAISFFGDDKVKMLEKFNIGQEVEVGVNISSREYNGKWFTQCDGWKINVAGQTQAPKELNSSDNSDDDLPF